MNNKLVNDMNIYYAIWADAINYERIKNGGENHWKLFTFSYMSLLLSFNIATILCAILLFTGYNVAEKIEQFITFTSSKLLTDLSWAIVTLFVPSMIITYFSVFYNQKHEYILSRYKFRQGKLLLIYFVLTMVLFFGISLLNQAL